MTEATRIATDYVTNGASLDALLAMFYSVPLAPIYRENRHMVIRPDGRVHGIFGDTKTMFVITPDDLSVWEAAYDANIALFPPHS
ncbi:hypothetical protein NVP1250O_92 [Vibrio phage 1.250.O._10N.261.55.E11]|nr:hypothetical protein NVP1250O_92 [Vibrio phage 1.250.O._10N.261.55.E11]